MTNKTEAGAISYENKAEFEDWFAEECVRKQIGGNMIHIVKEAMYSAWQASRTAQSEADATSDQCIDLAIALEQRRALKIVADVRALRFGKGPDPMMPTQEESFFDLACEEIETRLRTEKWSLNGVDMPLPAQSKAELVYQIRSSINLWIDVTPQRYEDLKGTPENSRILYATPASVKPAESGEYADQWKALLTPMRNYPEAGLDRARYVQGYNSCANAVRVLISLSGIPTSPIGAGDAEPKS